MNWSDGGNSICAVLHIVLGHKSKTDLRQPEEGLPRDDHTWRRKLLGEAPHARESSARANSPACFAHFQASLTSDVSKMGVPYPALDPLHGWVVSRPGTAEGG